MKKLFLTLALVAGFAAGALAQSPTYYANSISLPSVILNSTGITNLASPMVIDCRKQQYTRVWFKVASADASSTTNVTFRGGWSYDGSNYDTNNASTNLLTACMLAGKPCITYTNVLTANGAGYFIIDQINIGANSQVTNIAAGYSTKISSP